MNIEKYKKVGSFKLSSGLQSEVYYDLKEAMGEPQNLMDMTDKLELQIINYPDIIIGLEYGGIPLAISLSLRLNIPYAILRKETKQYGIKNRIEGYQGKGKVLIVDDVSTTGKSIDDAHKYLESIGYNVVEIQPYFTRKTVHSRCKYD